jgi:hypothetical protein
VITFTKGDASTFNITVNTGSINTGSFATTGSNIFSGSQTITGSLNVSGSITGSLLGTSSYATSASYALTASAAPLYLPLAGGTMTGDLIINGTASIGFLNVTYESSSVIFSSGSNQFGDATNDTQTLIGTVIVSGSQQITGSLNVTQGITGSHFGTSSYATSASQAISSSYALTSTSASFASSSTSASFAATASYALNAVMSGVASFYLITINMSAGAIDTGGTPIASVVGPNGENKTTLEGLGWSFTCPTTSRLTVLRPSSKQVLPLINVMTHGNNSGNIYSKAPTGQSTGAFSVVQTLATGSYTTFDLYSISSTNTGCASSGTTTVGVTFGLIS